jgi:hypothetical protein
MGELINDLSEAKDVQATLEVALNNVPGIFPFLLFQNYAG